MNCLLKNIFLIHNENSQKFSLKWFESYEVHTNIIHRKLMPWKSLMQKCYAIWFTRINFMMLWFMNWKNFEFLLLCKLSCDIKDIQYKLKIFWIKMQRLWKSQTIYVYEKQKAFQRKKLYDHKKKKLDDESLRDSRWAQCISSRNSYA